MMYELELTPDAIEDINFFKKSGDKALLKKLSLLLNELIEHPMEGNGQPEELKYGYSRCWSRRLDTKHRLVYRIDEERASVIILFLRGHYKDK